MAKKKTHKTVNGHLIQTNKRWGQLSYAQRERIAGWLREEYFRATALHRRVPCQDDKEAILSRVRERIAAGGIWIPSGEVRRYYESRVNRYRKSLLKQHPDLRNQDAGEETVDKAD